MEGGEEIPVMELFCILTLMSVTWNYTCDKIAWN